MKIHTCMISYHRPDVIKRALASYLETVSMPFSLVVVDNGSELELTDWLRDEFDHGLLLLGENKYPGYACNRGWELAPADADLYHRADNDFIYREGWCDEIEERFAEDPKLGQLGLLTDEQEVWAPSNVGGNCVIRKELWKKGLRYDERPWPELDYGWSEDSYLSPTVLQYGYRWARVHHPIIDGITTPDPNDPYYITTYAARHISSILESIE